MAHLTDMEELLATIPGINIRDYMREAMNCYMAGAYRGAMVLSYIALFDDLLVKLGELGSVNATAKVIHGEAHKKKTDQDVYESYLIDQLTSKSFISGLDSSFLHTLRNLRNKSAHPSGHKPSAEEARFIFHETITRFLSQPILSTTHLVDELVARLGNTNFFPSVSISDIAAVVVDETSTLHDEAIPQLVPKLTNGAASAEAALKTNSKYFLIGLASLDKPTSNASIQTKVLSAKADDSTFEDLITQLLSANGKLVVGLSGTTMIRIRAIIAKKIAETASTVNEAKLIHPTSTLFAISKAISEADFVTTFASELKSLFEKRAHSPFVVKLVQNKPLLLPIFFPILLANAGSYDFGTANVFAGAVEAVDEALGALLSDAQAFELLIAIKKAAGNGAWSALGIANANFAGIPTLRKKAIAHIEADGSVAMAYVESKLGEVESATDFITSTLTDEVTA